MAFGRSTRFEQRHAWLGAMTVAALVISSMLAMLFLSRSYLREQAEMAAQRAVIALPAGTDEGSAFLSDAAPVAALPPPDLPDAELPHEIAQPPQTGTEAEPAATEPVDARSPSARIPPQETPDITARDLPPIAAVEPGSAALPAENASLTETTASGVLPAMGKDGAKPSQYYARPFQRIQGTPLIAVLVPNLGQKQEVTEIALHLPPEVSLSFSPYGRELSQWNRNARALGHETFLDLAFAANTADDAGPLALNATQWQERLTATFMRLPAIAGVFAWSDESFSADPVRAKAVAEELKKRGLFLLAGQSGSGFGSVLASGLLQGVSADRTLPELLPAAQWKDAWAWAETRARERKTAFIVVPATPMALASLAEWLATLPSKNIALAPVSALVPELKAPAPIIPQGEEKAERHNPALEDGKAEKKPAAAPAHH